MRAAGLRIGRILADGMMRQGDIVKELKEVRKEIDEIDQQLAVLFEKRMQAVVDVARWKQAHNLPVFDEAREKEVLEKNMARIGEAGLKEDFGSWMQEMMDLSKKRQREILGCSTVAYCGVEGAFAHSVTSRMFPGWKQAACSSFDEVFKAVVERQARYGVVPLENSSAGLVGEVLDGLLKYPVFIDQAYDAKIHHCLLGTLDASLSDVKLVYSKDQALWQSKEFLDSLQVQTIPYPNTAMAAQFVASQNDPSRAAVGSSENAKLYSLRILASNIETESTNTTRFLVIGPSPNPQPGDHESLLISVNNEPGVLSRAINVISAFGLNMDCLQSRPRKGHPFEYFFYIQTDGTLSAPKLEACLQALKQMCTMCKWLGSYSIRKDEEE